MLVRKLPVVCVIAIVAGLVPAALGGSAAVAADNQYGPCCPLVHGSHWQASHGGAYWGAHGGGYAGPRYRCGTPQQVMLQYGANTYPLDAVEAADSLLVPVRTFGLVGATVDWSGGRMVTASLGSRTLTLTLGGHTVRAAADGSTSEVSWNLCPRLRNDVAYVPLRSMAEALGFTVDWAANMVKLEGNEQAVAAAPSAAECPVTKLETELGVKAVHGQVTGRYGPGVGILEVDTGGNGERLGLHSKDVILACSGKRVTCPRDLEEIMAQTRAGTAAACTMTVVRDGAKVDLQCPAKTP